MDLFSFKKSFFFPRVKRVDIVVVREGFTEFFMGDILIVGIVLPTSAR
jgi:hypothetical protein